MKVIESGLLSIVIMKMLINATILSNTRHFSLLQAFQKSFSISKIQNRNALPSLHFQAYI